MRPRILQVVLMWGVCLLAAPDLTAQQDIHNVVLVTLDGARHQEIFGGLDAAILQSMDEKRPVEQHPSYGKYWAPTPEERRMKLMPFFWGTLMTEGSIAGNPRLGSIVKVTNRHWFSYPGYAEILTGEAHDSEINSNDLKQNPFETVLEFVRRKLRLDRRQVAAFTSWAVFSGIVEHAPGSITHNVGAEAWDIDDPLARQVSELQTEAFTPWPLVRHDAFTFRLAMTYLKTERPRLLYLALDETDDWAHDGKYELVLDSLARTDRQLRELWEWLQSDRQYRGRTALLITTDHGRGRGVPDWRSHGAKIDGADEIWMAFAAPGAVSRGEWRNAPTLFQNQVASTIAGWLGLDFGEAHPSAGPPIPLGMQPVAAGAR
jgi:hypothetical protein